MRTHARFTATTIALAFLLAGASQTAMADSYKVDPVHSFALFSIHHFNAGHVWGRFNDPQGEFTIDPADASRDSFHVELKIANLDTGNSKRDSDLKGPDWFNARQFPAISFKSTGVRQRAQNMLDVTGNLTIHGVTRPVTVAVELTGTAADPFGNARSGIEATATIKRGDFGMKAMPGAVGEDVRLIVALEGIRQK